MHSLLCSECPRALNVTTPEERSSSPSGLRQQRGLGGREENLDGEDVRYINVCTDNRSNDVAKRLVIALNRLE